MTTHELWIHLPWPSGKAHLAAKANATKALCQRTISLSNPVPWIVGELPPLTCVDCQRKANR